MSLHPKELGQTVDLIRTTGTVKGGEGADMLTCTYAAEIIGTPLELTVALSTNPSRFNLRGKDWELVFEAERINSVHDMLRAQQDGDIPFAMCGADWRIHSGRSHHIIFIAGSDDGFKRDWSILKMAEFGV